jgi:hypothetical protein
MTGASHHPVSAHLSADTVAHGNITSSTEQQKDGGSIMAAMAKQASTADQDAYLISNPPQQPNPGTTMTTITTAAAEIEQPDGKMVEISALTSVLPALCQVGQPVSYAVQQSAIVPQSGLEGTAKLLEELQHKLKLESRAREVCDHTETSLMSPVACIGGWVQLDGLGGDSSGGSKH